MESDEDWVEFQNGIDSLDLELGPAPGTSLCEAICRGDEQTVREEALHLRGPSTLGPKRQAILAGRPDFLKVLLERDDYIEEDIVASACERKDLHSIRLLLDYGWPINQPLFFRASLLYTAIDDLAFLQWLIANGADINARSSLDESVLSVAIAQGSIEVVYFLLAQKPDITRGDLLHCAAQRKDQSEGAVLVSWLARQGASVNAFRYDNSVAFRWRAMSKLPTPLHVACAERNVPVARVLLQHGADPHREMLQAGEPTPPTAIEQALETGDQELIALLTATDSSY